MKYLDENGVSHLWTKVKDKLGEYVKSVNGTLPDETGNVTVTVTAQQPEFVVKDTVAEALEWLSENGDKSKVYVLPDGYMYKYMTREITYERPNCTNLLVLDECIAGCRISSNGSVKDDTPSYSISNVFKVTPGKTHQFRAYDTGGIHNIVEFSDMPGELQVGVIPSTYVKQTATTNLNPTWENPKGLVRRADLTVSADTNYVALVLYKLPAEMANSYITVDEPVDLGTTTITEEVTEWTNTMQSYNSTDYEDRIIALEESSTEYDNRLKALETDTSYIPSYWQTHLDEKVPLIRETMASVGKNKSAFLFYSDAHWNGNAGNSPMLLKYLYKYTPINKVNFGGDIVATESATFSDMAYLYDSWRSAIRDLPNHHSVAGNHDDRNESGYDHGFSKEYVYSFLLAPEETNDRVDGAELYYYIDDKCENTRYLYLDTACYDAHILSVEQAQFIVDALKSTPVNYHIVVIAHCWYNQNYDNFPTVTASGLTTTTTKLLELFGAYNNKKSGTLSPLGNASNNGSVSYDFTSVVGKVEFCIGGHLHNDYNETFNGIPVILCEADTMHNRNGSVSTKGTISEQCITAVIADYANSKINLIRIGRGSDREINI